MRKRLTAPVVLASLAVVVAGCSATAVAEPETFTISGHITTTGSLIANDNVCSSDRYQLVRGGTEMRVTDASGTLIGVGKLRTPTSRPNPQLPNTRDCVFVFNVPDLPAGGTFYELWMGDTKIETLTETEAQTSVTHAA